jgi:hypothetical protein
MNFTSLAFIVAAVLILIIVTCTFTKTKLGILQISLCIIVYFFAVTGVSLVAGLPKPIFTEVHKVEIAEILYIKLVPDVKIYLILTWKGLEDPIYYSLPWDRSMVDDLQQAQSKATANGVPLMMRNPFESHGKHGRVIGGGTDGTNHHGAANGSGSSGNDENEETFYPAPPAPSPIKPNDLLDGGAQ